MTRPITLFTGQWADLPFEEVARLAGEWGYDGLEIACWGDHLDPWRWEDEAYVQSKLDVLERNGLKVWTHLQPPQGSGRLRRPDRRTPPGHPLGPDLGRRRPGGRAPARGRGDEEHRPARGRPRGQDGDGLHRLLDLEVRRDVPAGLGRDDRSGLPGLRRPLEPDPRRLRRGRRALRARGAPLRDRLRLLDDRAHPRGDRPPRGVRAQLGPQPHGLAGHRPRGVPLGLQGPDHHVHCKDTKKRLGNGRNGRLSSHLPWADPRRGWDFVSTGHGDVPWEDAFRMLNAIGYDGPISVEWEDAGMDRLVGAPEALSFVRRLSSYEPSGAAFDAAFSTRE